MYVIRVEERSAGAVEFEKKNDNDRYISNVTFNVKADAHKEYYLKLIFANATGTTVRGKMIVDGKSYATAPFHATGDSGMGVVYIPVIAEKETSFKVRIDFSGSVLDIYSAELVDVVDRWVP